MPSVLRSSDGEPQVTNMELFFDLVYVFAVTQLSHTLLGHLTVRGAIEVLVLFAGVWWAWNYMAWATNWIDPDQLPVRVLMIGLMMLSLVMSASIPEAFDGQALGFAGAYVALQLVRGGFMVWAFRGVMRHNYANLVGWSANAGVAWIAGALVDSTDLRLALWILAVLLDYGAPAARFWLPGRGGTPMSDWTLAPAHLAERCQLVIIIALGESILVTGATFSELHRDAATVAAFVAAFAGSAALWWLYFARHSGAALVRVAHADDPVRLGRGGYAYAHAVAVAGIIVTAVGDELVLAHPTGHMTTATALTVLGGTGLFMAGIVAFVASTGGVDREERLATIACYVALAILGVVATAISPLALSILTAVLLYALVAYAAIHARDPEGRTSTAA